MIVWKQNSAHIYITESLKHSSNDSRTTMNVELHAVLSRKAVRTCWHEYSNYTRTKKQQLKQLWTENQTWKPEDKSTVQYFPGVGVCDVT